MGKYKLHELLNEIQGGRTGTYLVTPDELERVRDTIKEFSGMRYRQRGPSKDGKVAFEYEFDPKRGGAFSIYPFKFNPSNISEPVDLPFSVAGDIGTAIFYVKRAAKMLDLKAEIFKGNQFQNQNENLEEAKEDKKEGIELTQSQMDKLHKTGVITIAGVDNNGNKIKTKLYFPKVTKENKIEEVTMANVNVDEIKMHLDAFKAGTIDGNDLHQAISEIFFGEVVAPGLKEMTADEFGGDEESVARIAKFQNKSREQVRQEVSDIEYEEIADKLGKNLPPIDRSKFTKAQLGRIIVDLVYDGDLGKAFRAIDSKNLEEMKSQREIEKELERIENLGEMKIDTGMFIDDDEFEMEMVKDKAKEIKPLFPDVSMEDLIDFVKTHRQDIEGMSDEEIKDEYREYQSVNVSSPSDFMEEDKALREHFGRFLKNYQ